jgi:hypothetical protein
LIDDGFVYHTETHVHAGGKFATTATHPSLDLGDGDFIHRPNTLTHRMKVAQLQISLCIAFSGKFQNVRYVVVGNEKIRICALKYDDRQGIIVFEFCHQAHQFLVQRGGDDVDRRVVDCHRGNPAGNIDP